MKSLLFFLLALFQFHSIHGQHPVEMRNLWAIPRVHILFEGYTVSFAIRDINKALILLRETGDSTNPENCALDTGRDYIYELYPGIHMEYHHLMQPLIQNVVGAFLLSAGHAVVENAKHKILGSLIMDIGMAGIGEQFVFIHFYDPKNHKLVFEGKMAVDMYKKDLGIDD